MPGKHFTLLAHTDGPGYFLVISSDLGYYFVKAAGRRHWRSVSQLGGRLPSSDSRPD